MESQSPIAGAPMAAIDEATARRMVVAVAARPHTSSGRLLTLADNLDEAALLASEPERPKICEVARIVREMAPLWPDGMSGIAPVPPDGWAEGERSGIERAARKLESHLDERVHESWSYDPSTNAWEAPNDGEEARDIEGREYVDLIRALLTNPQAAAVGATP